MKTAEEVANKFRVENDLYYHTGVRLAATIRADRLALLDRVDEVATNTLCGDDRHAVLLVTLALRAEMGAER